jgi:ABC-type multidrug transport system ATPase subunit
VFGWTSAPACAGCGGEARWRRRGVDVGAIVEIPELMQRLADEGKAVVVISSYLPEITALSNRILASRQGKVVEEFSALEATKEKIIDEGHSLSEHANPLRSVHANRASGATG